jgi:hypothetical protein
MQRRSSPQARLSERLNAVTALVIIGVALMLTFWSWFLFPRRRLERMPPARWIEIVIEFKKN